MKAPIAPPSTLTPRALLFPVRNIHERCYLPSLVSNDNAPSKKKKKPFFTGVKACAHDTYVRVGDTNACACACVCTTARDPGAQGFLFQEAEKAGEYFEQAKSCFQRALNEEPTNEIYKKALEMTDKAPGLHAELQRQLARGVLRVVLPLAGRAPRIHVIIPARLSLRGHSCVSSFALAFAFVFVSFIITPSLHQRGGGEGEQAH